MPDLPEISTHFNVLRRLHRRIGFAVRVAIIFGCTGVGITHLAIAQDTEGTPAQRLQAAREAAEVDLREIAELLTAEQLGIAQTRIRQVPTDLLDPMQQRQFLFLRAQLAYRLGQYPYAVAELSELTRLFNISPQLNADTETPKNRIAIRNILQLLADAQQAAKQPTDALLTLLLLDTWQIPSPTEAKAQAQIQVQKRISNQRRILSIINSLDSPNRQLLLKSSPDASLPGWVALSESVRIADPDLRRQTLQQWRGRYSAHPATANLLADYTSSFSTSAPSSPRNHIALLLPLSSSSKALARSAQAFHDGFMTARESDTTLTRPTVVLHDIGNDPDLTSLYARDAVQNGANFIVGPLGRNAVNTFLQAQGDKRLGRTPMLVIGAIPPTYAAPNRYGISMSPEPEARQLAERAFADGHRHAGIIQAETSWGKRVANAFTQRWEELGGIVVANQVFARDLPDYSQQIRLLLGLDASNRRMRILETRLQRNLEFISRRRADIDFLLIATESKSARLLVPQLRFHQAHDLPAYATSRVYTGIPNTDEDADLNGTLFGDINWKFTAEQIPMLRAGLVPGLDAPSSVATPNISQPSRAERNARVRRVARYQRTDLYRLYALGVESYHLIPRLAFLRENPDQRYFGETMDFSVRSDGNARRYLTWMRFIEGIPLAAAPPEYRKPVTDAVSPFAPSSSTPAKSVRLGTSNSADSR